MRIVRVRKPAAARAVSYFPLVTIMKMRLIALCVLLMVAALPYNAQAASVTCGSFGTLAGATFGGSGIPNDDVCIGTFLDSGNTITLGLTATERFSNPPLTDDNAGTFYGVTGGDVANGQPTYARDNFDFYLSQTGGSYCYTLLYDLNPAAGTPEAGLGSFNFGCGSGAGTVQDSWNQGFAFLAGAPGGPFNPNVAGEYSYVLSFTNQLGAAPLGRVAINVNVTADGQPPAAVPEPASLLLLGSGLAGAGWRAKRQRKAKQTAP